MLPSVAFHDRLMTRQGRSGRMSIIHEAEETILNQKLLLESLIESVLDGILIVSPTGEMLHHNQRFLDIWNFPAEVIESRGNDEHVCPSRYQTRNDI